MKRTRTIFFNGPPGVGKSTLAEYFAKNATKGANIDLDEIRHFQKAGVSRDPNDRKFVLQKKLAFENALCLINNFRKHNVDTFISDLVLDPKIIAVYEEVFSKLTDLVHILLLPDIEVAKERNKLRDEWSVMEEDVINKYYNFADSIDIPEKWIVLDTSELTVEEAYLKINEVL